MRLGRLSTDFVSFLFLNTLSEMSFVSAGPVSQPNTCFIWLKMVWPLEHICLLGCISVSEDLREGF